MEVDSTGTTATSEEFVTIPVVEFEDEEEDEFVGACVVDVVVVVVVAAVTDCGNMIFPRTIPRMTQLNNSTLNVILINMIAAEMNC